MGSALDIPCSSKEEAIMARAVCKTKRKPILRGRWFPGCGGLSTAVHGRDPFALVSKFAADDEADTAVERLLLRT